MANQPIISLPASNLAKVERLRRPVRIKNENGFCSPEVETFDLSRVSPSEIANDISQPRAVAISSLLANAVNQEKDAATECAVYVVAGPDANVSKIGLAKNPLHRLAGLQGGNWAELYLAALVWFYSDAAEVERLALKRAKEQGLRLKGEWVGVNPIEASLMVARAIVACKADAAGPEMWMRNRSRLRDAKLEEISEQDTLPGHRLDFERFRWEPHTTVWAPRRSRHVRR